MAASAWMPAVAWMALILWLGSDGGSAERTSRFILPTLHFLFPSASPLQLDAMHAFVRKLAHLTEYAILSALWLRAFLVGRGIPRPRAAWLGCAIAVTWGVVDESLQVIVPSRSGSLSDVLIDALGALLVAVPAAVGPRRSAVALTGVASWIAAAGGGALIMLNLVTDVSPGILWLPSSLWSYCAGAERPRDELER